MSEYKPYIDDDGRLHLFSICDGTLIFLQELIYNLNRLCCRDIDHSTTILTEGFPEDKPWMNCLFEASGKLPWYLWPGARIIEMNDGGYGILGPEELPQRENRYQDSACYQWSRKMLDDSVSAYIRKLVGKEKNEDESNYYPSALGDTHCFLRSKWEVAQKSGDKKLEDQLSGPLGDTCGEDST